MAAPLLGRVYFGAADAVAVRRWRVDWIGHSCCEDWKDRNTCLDSGLAELSCEVWPKTFGLWYRKWGKSDTRQDRVMLGLEIPKMKNLTIGNLKFTVCLLRWPGRDNQDLIAMVLVKIVNSRQVWEVATLVGRQVWEVPPTFELLSASSKAPFYHSLV